MRIPKTIDELLKRRTRQAEALDRTCGKIDQWLLKNDIDPGPSCWLSGVEIYVHSEAAEEEVRKAIEERIVEDA